MPPTPSGNKRRGRAALAAGVAAVAVVWLVLLPRLGDVRAVRDRIAANEARGVNPGAMYYTELEAMGPIRDRVDRLREADGPAFWRPSFRTDDGGE